MDVAAFPPPPWFRKPRVLAIGAVLAAAVAMTGAAVGIASARGDGAQVEAPPSSGGLSVVVQPMKERGFLARGGPKLATLDPAMMQQVSITGADLAGDENLRLIAAQERRLTLMNAREAETFAAQMRQDRRDDAAMERETRAPSEERPVAATSSTSNSTDENDQESSR